MPDGLLSTFTLHLAFQRLSELAAANNVVIELALCHGAVISLCYAKTEGGRGLRVERGTCVAALARQTAAEMRLRQDWLEEDVRFYLALANARHRLDSERFGPHLILSVPAPEHLLAMKLEACQVGVRSAAKDVDDLRFLIAKTKPTSFAAVEAVYAKYFPGGALTKGVEHLVAELLPAIA